MFSLCKTSHAPYLIFSLSVFTQRTSSARLVCSTRMNEDVFEVVVLSEIVEAFL